MQTSFEFRPPLTVEELAVALGVCRSTAYRLVYERAIPHIKIRSSVPIPAAAVDAYLGSVLVASRK